MIEPLEVVTVEPTENVYARSRNPSIETLNGVFDCRTPTYDIRDIAGALAKKCRFNGQCKFFYSVAEHSVLVSRLMELLDLGDPREGLLHDACEAYGPDVASPQKHLFPDLQRYEHARDSEIRAAFGLPAAKTDGCTVADTLAVLIEAYDLMPSRGTGPLWGGLAHMRKEALQQRKDKRFQIFGHKDEHAKRLFWRRYKELS